MYFHHYLDCFRWQNLRTQDLLWTRLPPKTYGNDFHHENKYSERESKQWEGGQPEHFEAMEVRNQHRNHFSCFEERNVG